MQPDIGKYKNEINDELHQILNYWENNTIDVENGGFFGFISNDNKIDLKANKGLILNARILWTFSAAYQQIPSEKYLEISKRAYHYLIDCFFDSENEGFYWMLDYKGNPLDKKKQIYGQAFVIYSFVEYYKITNDKDVLEQAIQLFRVIEKYSFDTLKKGYFEAFSGKWEQIDDLRLSEKDANEKKTMNTHLHILEAYTNLYSVWKNDFLLQQLQSLIDVFLDFIIHPKEYYQNLFFDENWNVKSSIISYGHDIETSWLLWKAAKAVDNKELSSRVKDFAIKVGESSLKGIDQNNGLNYEYNAEHQHLDTDKHWWVQAEALVGYFNLYQLTNDEKYLVQSVNTWKFTQQNIIDHKNGEWFWGKKSNGELMSDEKVGFWKCPYHNARACFEIVSRVDKMLKQKVVAA